MDVRRGFVSPEGAARNYGVVIQDGAVDADATVAQRQALAAEQPSGFYDYGAERESFEAIWTRTNYDALTGLLASLPTHWRFFALVGAMVESERKRRRLGGARGLRAGCR